MKKQYEPCNYFFDFKIWRGTGCFVAGLEFSAGATAEVVGKPEPRFFEAAMEALKVEDPRVADLKREGEELSFFCLNFFLRLSVVMFVAAAAAAAAATDVAVASPAGDSVQH